MNWKKRIKSLESAIAARHPICPLCKQDFRECKHSRNDLYRELERAKIEYIVGKRMK